MRMQRIVIIGSSGSGKSTLAREVGDSLKLPVIHLDKYYWHPGWVGTAEAEWQKTVATLIQGDQWIIDGNFRQTLDMRLKAADTIIFLDMPRWLCAWRAVKRRLQYQNNPRPDMAEGCQESLFKPDFPEFLLRIWDYPSRARPDIEQKLSLLPPQKRIIRLTSRKQSSLFLADPLQYAARISPTSYFSRAV